MPTGLELTLPWLLVALPMLLLLPRARGWLLRILALAALLLAVAGPTVRTPGGDLAVLVDVSASVGDGARQALAEFSPALPDYSSILLFAGETGAFDPTQSVPPEIETNSTDLARALQVAAAQGAERILLLSDGAQSEGDAMQALPRVPVDTYRVMPRDNARLVSLILPERASPGETVEGVAVVETDVATAARLLVEGDGSELAIERDLPAGRTLIPFRAAVPAQGDLALEASLEVDFEQSGVDDRRSGHVTVQQEEPVLVLGDPALAALLESQGVAAFEGSAESLQAPLPYSAVVLRGSAANFTPGQLTLLQGYVQNGGGLMMTGGPESFGFGGWYRTPVEEVLPVDTDLRTQVDIPLVALVIVMDRSQSMATGNPSKIELAKEGALGVVEVAYEQDLLGMVVFSDQHEWLFGPREATERGKREMTSAILSLGTGGGTILEPAYRAALTELRRSDAALKHVIILSDGNLYDGRDPFGGGSPPDFEGLASRAAEEGITTSAIAIGRSADFERLQDIAEAGGGRYHGALDVTTLPRIFTSEALTATRSLLREGPLRPVAHDHPLLPPLGQLPPVDAYIATAIKPTAELLLEGQHDEPLLAVRRTGLGRTAALTTDLNGWTGELGSSPELATALTSVVSWLQARPATYSAAVTSQGERARVVVDAVEDGEYVNGANLIARVDGTSTELQQVAPGRYEAVLSELPAQGEVLIVEGGEIVSRATLDSPHPEFESAGGARLLTNLSSRTGGLVVTSPEQYSPDLQREGRPLWPYFAGAGLLLFLTELVLRRFAPPVRGAAGRARPG